MLELNANLAVIAFAFLGALSSFLNARRAGRPLVPALNSAAGTLAFLGMVGFLCFLALNALHLRWDSLAGLGLMLAVGLAGAMLLLAFKSWWHRRGSF